MLNIIIIVGVIIAIWVMWRNSKKTKVFKKNIGTLDLDMLMKIVKNTIIDSEINEDSSGLTDDELLTAKTVSRANARAKKRASYGFPNDINVVESIIKGIISDTIPEKEEHKLDLILLLDNRGDAWHRFEALIYYYQTYMPLESSNKYGTKALAKIISTHQLTVRELGMYPKPITIDDEKMHTIYEKENPALTYDDKVKILSRIVFSLYKGFGKVTTIYQQEINGFMIGTSGSKSIYNKSMIEVPTRSVWVNSNSNYIHFKFLDLETIQEMTRIVKQFLWYGGKGDVTEQNPKQVTKGWDDSRVTVSIEPATPVPTAWIRKFPPDKIPFRAICYADYKRNWEVVMVLIFLFQRGLMNIVLTGQQGSGKTTFMKSIIELYDPQHNLRTLEKSSEINANLEYPDRNVTSFTETSFLDIKELQDIQKKSDGAIALVGEVADDLTAVILLQLLSVGTLATMATHHAKTPGDLVEALATSIAAYNNSDKELAARQISEQLDIVVDLGFVRNSDGTTERFVKLISYIDFEAEAKEYPAKDKKEKEDVYQNRLNREFYTRSTDRRVFNVIDLIRYDIPTHTYYVCNTLPEKLVKKMLGQLLNQEKEIAVRLFNSVFQPGNINRVEPYGYDEPLITAEEQVVM